jgi:hypothetical protein
LFVYHRRVVMRQNTDSWMLRNHWGELRTWK